MTMFPITFPSEAMSRQPPTYWDDDGLLLHVDDGSTTLITAAYSNLKTTFALDRAIAVARRRNLKVLYVVAEGAGGFGSLTINAAAADWNKYHPAAEDQIADDWLDAHLHLIETVPTIDTLQHLADEQMEWNPDIVILDTMGAVASGMNLSETGVGTKIGAAFKKFCQRLRCDLWIVHHLGKDESAGPTGSRYYMNDTDQALEMQFDEKTMLLAVELTKTRWSRKHSLNYGVRIVKGLTRPGWTETQESIAVHDLPRDDARRLVTAKETQLGKDLDRVVALIDRLGKDGALVTQDALIAAAVVRESGEDDQQFAHRRDNFRKNVLVKLVWTGRKAPGKPGPMFGYVNGVATENREKPRQPFTFKVPLVSPKTDF